jgi:NAD kinase
VNSKPDTSFGFLTSFSLTNHLDPNQRKVDFAQMVERLYQGQVNTFQRTRFKVISTNPKRDIYVGLNEFFMGPHPPNSTLVYDFEASIFNQKISNIISTI